MTGKVPLSLHCSAEEGGRVISPWLREEMRGQDLGGGSLSIWQKTGSGVGVKREQFWRMTDSWIPGTWVGGGQHLGGWRPGEESSSCRSQGLLWREGSLRGGAQKGGRVLPGPREVWIGPAFSAEWTSEAEEAGSLGPGTSGNGEEP